MHPLIVALLLGLLGCGGGTTGASAPAPPGPSARATAPMHPSGLDVVLLGTGTPVADPARHGPSTGLVFGGRGLVVDTGPGVVRRLAEAAKLHGQPALEPGNVGLVLLTHLHSDHTTGLPDLILGGWVLGRRRPLTVIGPPGTRALVDGILAGWAADIALRKEVEGLTPAGIEVRVMEVTDDAEVFGRDGLSITAFHVPHGTWAHAFGFRIEGGGRRVVISGDTDRSDAVAAQCDGCDLLIHEVVSDAYFRRSGDMPGFERYHGQFHTTPREVGEVATAGRAQHVVLTHQLFFGDDDAGLIRGVKQAYDGPVTSGVDLQRF